MSAGLILDLRYSQAAMFDRYAEIVIGGSLAARGMPSFKQSVSEADLAASRGYVLSRRAQIARP
ncbi:MAG: hypothetical protein ACT4QD_21755 [Acidobacteriota bacterium]